MNLEFEKIDNIAIINIIKPLQGNPFNTYTIYGIVDILDMILNDNDITTIIIKGYVERGLDISQIMGSIKQDILLQIRKDFENNVWEMKEYDLPDTLNVLKYMLSGMFQILHYMNKIHNKGINTIGLCNNAIAGGAALLATCNRIICRQDSMFWLPEIFFDIPVGDLAYFLRKKGVKDNTIKLYTLGDIFTADKAYKYGLVDKICNNLDIEFENIINNDINFEDRDIEEYVADIKTIKREKRCIDHTIKIVNQHKQDEPSNLWKESEKVIINNLTELSILKLLNYIWKDKRFDELSPYDI